jgi:hypothetical protein
VCFFANILGSSPSQQAERCRIRAERPHHRTPNRFISTERDPDQVATVQKNRTTVGGQEHDLYGRRFSPAPHEFRAKLAVGGGQEFR